MIIINVVKHTSKELVLKLKLDDEKTLGISKKITNGFTMPPVKNSKTPNCAISNNKNIDADLSDNWVFL